jgi:hypothetical protein
MSTRIHSPVDWMSVLFDDIIEDTGSQEAIATIVSLSIILIFHL